MSACVASLLEIPIESVPRFIREPGDTHMFQWAERLDDFLEPFGLYAMHFAADPARAAFPGVLHIMTGISPRGRPHAVIGKGRRIVHDPHPDKTGLFTIDGFCLIVPRWEGRASRAAPAASSRRAAAATPPRPGSVPLGLLSAARDRLEMLLTGRPGSSMVAISCAGARRPDGSYVDTRPPGRGLLMEGETQPEPNAVEVAVDRREMADRIRREVGDEIMGVPIVYSAREEWSKRIPYAARGAW